jgi:hypothetical protein
MYRSGAHLLPTWGLGPVPRDEGLDHGQSFTPFSAAALAFLSGRLHGLAVADGCRSIGPGNSLSPLKP